MDQSQEQEIYLIQLPHDDDDDDDDDESLCAPNISQDIARVFARSCARPVQELSSPRAFLAYSLWGRKPLDYALPNGTPADSRSCSRPQ